MNYRVFVILLFLTLGNHMVGQDPARFAEEISSFSKIEFNNSKPVTVITGSSSVRFWKSVDEDCEMSQFVNTGFGGSHMSDLLFYIEEAVLRFNPSTVYIYEGDNDIAANKKPEDVIHIAKSVVQRIWEHNRDVNIYFISAKPSPSRWSFENQYSEFNTQLKTYCNTEDKIHYIDVWDVMIDEYGRPRSSLFLEDSLHMNATGYIIWKDVICPKN